MGSLTIAVIGAGVSGIRAALTLARAGHSVTLVEKNRHLGGRAFSFPTADFGEIDIGQHIWLKCCTAFEDLLRDLQVPDEWVYRQAHFALPYRLSGDATFTLRSTGLPGLLHLLPGLMRFPGLGIRAKVRLLYGLARARLYSATALEALDGVSFAEWLRRQGQSPSAVARMWEPIVLAVCNGRPEEVSARHALFTYRESLLHSRHAADICFFRRPLSAVLDRQARSILTAAGVEVRTGVVAHEVVPGSTVRVTLSGPEGNRPSPFDRVVLALPPAHWPRLLNGSTWPVPAGETAIAGLLLKFARPVMEELFFSVLDSPVQTVFNKTAVWGTSAGADDSQIVELVISGAGREIRLGVERVSQELLPELAKLLPRVRETPVVARRLLIHGAATFRVPPGGEKRRLPPTTPQAPHVYLAGDSTATGWPSTMESAARAGAAAAQAILQDLSRPTSC